MKRVLWLAMLLVASASAGEPTGRASTDPAVRIAKQSGLPLEEITRFLKDCDADQQSMNFCAWRDQLEAEDMIGLSVAHLRARLPSYRDCISAEVANAIQHIERKCASDAHRDYAGGFVETYQRTQCVALSETAYARSLETVTTCQSIE